MKIDQTTSEGITILAFDGELDSFNLGKVSAQLDELIADGAQIVFNLSKLKFVNSSALGYFVKTSKALKALDGELVLAEPSRFFQSASTTLGIDQVVKMFPTDADAVNYLTDG